MLGIQRLWPAWESDDEYQFQYSCGRKWDFNGHGDAAGGAHTCAVLSGGSVRCWGHNSFGQLGNGMTTNAYSTIPVAVSGISTATAIAAGNAHTCAVLSGGSVQCWGYNYSGQLGNGTNTASNIPVAVSGISTATAIAVGNYHTCAVLSGGSVQCWGSNGYGQLGNGMTTNTDSNIPVAVSGISTALGVATGEGMSSKLCNYFFHSLTLSPNRITN